MKTEVNNCFLCLEKVSSLRSSSSRNEDDGSKVHDRFWKFASKYLKVGGDRGGCEFVFCEDCQRLISSVCELYKELLQVELRLAWKLGEVARVLEGANRETGGGDHEVIKILRSSLVEKCLERSRKVLPIVDIVPLQPPKRAGTVFATPVNFVEGTVVKLEVDSQWEDVEGDFETDFLPDSNPFDTQFINRRSDRNDGEEQEYNPETGGNLSSSDSDDDSETDYKPGNKNVRVRVKKGNSNDNQTCEHCSESLVGLGDEEVFKHLQAHENYLRTTKTVADIPCFFCYKTFTLSQTLDVHVRVRHKNMLTCHFNSCFQKFTTQAEYSRHLKTHLEEGTEEKIQHCKICQLGILGIGYLQLHEILHTKYSPEAKESHRYICEVCDAGFYTPLRLQSHFNIKHGERLLLYKCSVEECQATFPTDKNLEYHMKIHKTSPNNKLKRKFSEVLKQDQMIHKGSKRATGGRDPKIEGDFKTVFLPDSNHCDTQFPNRKSDRNDGEEQEDNGGFSETGGNFSSSDSGDDSETDYKPDKTNIRVRVKKRNSNDNQSCEHCSKSFVGLEDEVVHLHLQAHENYLRKKKNVADIPCFFCHRTFVYSQTRDVHVRLYHKNMLTCHFNSCFQKFITEAEYSQHLKTHLEESAEEKVQHCKICQLGIIGTGYLQLHEILHTKCSTEAKGGHKYICEVCDAGFQIPARLQSHFNIKHGEKLLLYKCSVNECYATFPTDKNLEYHMKIHKTGSNNKLKPKFNQVLKQDQNKGSEHVIAGGDTKIEGDFETDFLADSSPCDSQFPKSERNDDPEQENVGGFSETGGNLSSSDSDDDLETDYKPGKKNIRVRVKKRNSNDNQTCEHCSEPFVGLGAEEVLKHLQAHESYLRTKKTVADIPCFFCHRTFVYSQTRDVHVRLYHKNMWTCYFNSCFRKFTTQAEYSQHLKTHLEEGSEEKIQHCKICHLGFLGSGYLQLHEILHTKYSTDGNKACRYRCEVCDAGFQTPLRLQSHFNIKHGEKLLLYKCSVNECHATFPTDKNLEYHMKNHKTGQNNKLKRKFSQVLKQDKMIHKGSKRVTGGGDPKVGLERSRKALPMVDIVPLHPAIKVDNTPTSLEDDTVLQFEEDSQLENVEGYFETDFLPDTSPCDSQFLNVKSDRNEEEQEVNGGFPKTEENLSSDSETSKSGNKRARVRVEKENSNDNQACEHCSELFVGIGDEELHQHLQMDGCSLWKRKNVAKIPCVFCHQDFGLSQTLDVHVSLCHKNILTCYFNSCFQKFTTHAEYSQHLKTHLEEGTEEKIQHCEICHLGFLSSGYLQLHEILHTEYSPEAEDGHRYICEVCDAGFHTPTRLQSHFNIKHGERLLLYKCSVNECHATFPTDKNLEYHMKMHKTGHHKVRRINKPKEGPDNRPKTYTQHVYACHSSKRCLVCNKTFQRSQSLKNHMIVAHGSGRPDHICHICGNVFKLDKLLAGHISRCHSSQSVARRTKKKHQCPHCQQDFTFKQLKKHVPLCSRGVFKASECKTCGKSFENWWPGRIHNHLITHMSAEEKVALYSEVGETHVCHICGKEVLSRHALKQHIKRHDSSNAKFKCPECPKFYFARCLLRSHILNEHGKEKADQFVPSNSNSGVNWGVRDGKSKKGRKCFFPSCGLQFRLDRRKEDRRAQEDRREDRLRNHVEQCHSGCELMCTACGKICQDEEKLKAHAVTHGEKHRCHLCSRSYLRETGLKEHLKMIHAYVGESSQEIQDSSVILLL